MHDLAEGIEHESREISGERENGDDPECPECHSINTHSSTCSKYPYKQNDADAGSHGHEYPGKMDGPFPVVRCNGADTVATQETMTDWRCEGCGDVIAGPPNAAQVLDA